MSTLPAVKPKPLTDTDHDLLNLLEQVWSLEGKFPSQSLLEEMFPALTNAVIARYPTAIKNPQFIYALSVRGITIENPLTAGILTELQLAVAATMFDYVDNRTFRKKLSELGVSTQTYQNWLKDPAFQSYITQRGERLLSEHQGEAHLMLIDRVRSGDLGAIKYFNELTGRYRPQPVQSAASNIDVNDILMRVLEIIQKHVNDPRVLSAISDDMLLLSRRANPEAALLMSAPVVTGQVVPPPVPLLRNATETLSKDLGL